MRRVSALVVCVALWMSLDPHEAVHGQQPSSGERPRVARGLMERALRRGSVPVIVGVRAPFVPEGRLTAGRRAEQREGFRAVRQRVLDRLAALPVMNVREFQSIPFFAAVVDSRALAVLAGMRDVATIQENPLRRPTLAESTALVGSNAAWTSGYTGLGWTIAVLDTGVQKTHPFFGGAVVSEACYSNGEGSGTSLCPGGVISTTATGSGVNCDTSQYGDCIHGTHVAGIAAGRNYSGGPGFNGVARQAGIISMQVFTGFTPAQCGDPNGSACISSAVSDEIEALERVLELRTTFRIAAVNLSLGGGFWNNQADCDFDNAAEKMAIDNLQSVGIATVVSSGNDGFFFELSAPACISSAISVASSGDGSRSDEPLDQVSSYSNVASFLNLFAPGGAINSSIPGNGFTIATGTSMAAPHVAGAWALMKQRKPLATVTEILNAFTTTGTPVTDTLGGGITKPRINVNSAVNAMRVDFMALDTPAAGTVQRQPFVMAGWALNMSAPLGSGTGVDTVHVWAFPSTGAAPILVGAATYGVSRPDVGAVFNPQFTNSGWNIVVRGLRPGSYTLNAYARNTFNGNFSHVQSVPNVTVQADPAVWIDTPVSGSSVTKPFVMSGWALDRAAAAGTGVDTVHVWAYPRPGSGLPPIFVGAASYGLARPDVGAAFGAQFTNTGWALPIAALPAAPHQIVAFGRSTVSNTFAALRSTFVTISEPVTTIDTPSEGSTRSQPFTVSGWAIDLAAPAGPGVHAIHVYAYRDPGSGELPTFVGFATYGLPRADVGAIFGPQFTNCGYSINVSALAAGTYRLAIFAHSSVSGSFQLRTVDIIVDP